MFVAVTAVHSAASHVRFRYGEDVLEAAVIEGLTALFFWDEVWFGRTHPRPMPFEMKIGEAWVPPVSSMVLAMPEDFRRAYLAYYGERYEDPRDERFAWAPQAFWAEGSFEEKLRMIECILDGTDQSDFALGCLAAGPIEDLFGQRLLEFVIGTPELRARWIPLLRQTYWRNEPDSLKERLRQLLGEA